MSAMEMMIKNMLGIDPVEIQARFSEGVEFLNKTVAMIDSRLTAIEGRLSAIEGHLSNTQNEEESNVEFHG